MKSKSLFEKHLGLAIYLSLLLIGCLLFIIPFIIGSIINKVELKELYSEVAERLNEVSLPTLHYEIEKVYRTNLKEYGIKIRFTTDNENKIVPYKIETELKETIEEANYAFNLCKGHCLYEFSLFITYIIFIATPISV